MCYHDGDLYVDVICLFGAGADFISVSKHAKEAKYHRVENRQG